MVTLANPVRLAEVVLPPREPDAVPRQPEHIRRAAEVLAHGAGAGAGHDLTMATRADAVTPNVTMVLGEVAR